MRVTRVEMRDFRNYDRAEVALPAGPDRHLRAERSRQDEPARGDLLRLHRPLAAHLQRARADPARRERGPGGARPGGRRGRAPARGGVRAGRAQAPAPGRSRARGPGGPRRAAGGERLHARAARARQGRPVRPPGASRPARGRGLAGPRRRHARRTRARWRSGTRCSPACVRAPAAPRRSGAWDAELAARGIELMANRREAVEGLRPVFADLAARLGLPGEAELRYRPRSPATTAEELVRRARGAPVGGPGSRLHRARAAPRRPAAAARRDSACAPMDRRASSASPCWRCCSPSAPCSRSGGAGCR